MEETFFVWLSSIPMSGVIPLSILVVEEEAIVRMLAVDVLQEAGFSVIATAHADEALQILENRASDIHVVFSDAHLPDFMNGTGLAGHVRACWPWIGVMLTSGKAVPPLDAIPGDICFLPKPYALGDLVNRVHEIASSKLLQSQRHLSGG